MNIGNIRISPPVFLAPMAGVTDQPFRILCKEQGVGVVYSEFVSADGIIRNNTKTLDLIRFTEIERPIGIQIFGNNPDVMGKAAKYVADTFQPDIIDINYGCPVPKITKKGAGSAALKDLSIMDEITHSVVESVSEIPVTVKMRSGWNKKSIVIPEAGVRLEKIGVKAITLHPRTATQSFNDKADWPLITELKNAVSIPIISNGDINSASDAIRMIDETRCDGIMIGRAALGNPWIFRDIRSLIEGKPILPPPTIEDRIKMCRRHFDLLLKNRGEISGLNLMKKHFGWYFKGFPGAAKFRQKLVTTSSYEKVKEELARFSHNNLL